MALSFPLTTLLGTPKGFVGQSFLLKSRQELSMQTNGVARGKDFGSALWFASYTTVEIPNDDAVAFEALLNSLDGVIQPFEAWDLRRPSPRVTPGTSVGVLSAVSSGKIITVGSLTSGQVMSAGDYVSFNYSNGSRALHQLCETVTAGNPVEVRPHVRPGYTIGASVQVGAPKGLFTLVPGSVQNRPAGGLHSVVSFEAVQYL